MNAPTMVTPRLCGDCVPEGALHVPGCDLERCACCGGQAITCRLTGTLPRVPYIQYPTLCVRCGACWPDLFMVPDEEWERYVAPRQRGEVICRPCYDEIKTLIDRAGRDG